MYKVIQYFSLLCEMFLSACSEKGKFSYTLLSRPVFDQLELERGSAAVVHLVVVDPARVVLVGPVVGDGHAVEEGADDRAQVGPQHRHPEPVPVPDEHRRAPPEERRHQPRGEVPAIGQGLTHQLTVINYIAYY